MMTPHRSLFALLLTPMGCKKKLPALQMLTRFCWSTRQTRKLMKAAQKIAWRNDHYVEHGVQTNNDCGTLWSTDLMFNQSAYWWWPNDCWAQVIGLTIHKTRPYGIRRLCCNTTSSTTRKIDLSNDNILWYMALIQRTAWEPFIQHWGNSALQHSTLPVLGNQIYSKFVFHLPNLTSCILQTSCWMVSNDLLKSVHGGCVYQHTVWLV